MSGYPLTWVTKNLAVGHAPMSYAELDSLKEQGIVAIVNLCGEFCDLHEIEEKAGFEVFYLPIPDETAPKMAEMEKGLEWLDEAIYLGKKVLVHCHHGIGRTGTFVTAYLLRRGFGLKEAGRILKATRANPTNFSQWWLLRKFGKKEGQLTVDEPTRDNRIGIDLSEFYQRYEQLLQKVDSLGPSPSPDCCPTAERQSCDSNFNLELIEALYLSERLNQKLSTEQRRKVIDLAQKASSHNNQAKESAVAGTAASPTMAAETCCPLRQDNGCLLHDARPVYCRLKDVAVDSRHREEIKAELNRLSLEVFLSLFKQQLDEPPPAVSFSDTVSGKFIQQYFQYLVARKAGDERN